VTGVERVRRLLLLLLLGRTRLQLGEREWGWALSEKASWDSGVRPTALGSRTGWAGGASVGCSALVALGTVGVECLGESARGTGA
jgi:hypothetical protein